MKKIFSFTAVLFLLAIFFSVSFSSCDMIEMKDPPSPGDLQAITEEEITRYEAEGRYLKLLSLPYYTKASNIKEVFVANASGPFAQIDLLTEIKVIKGEAYSTAYIPLAYNGGGEFIEDGPLFIALSIDIDAYTRISISLSDNVAVNFSSGRGVFDILDLDDMNRELPGLSYLTITNLPSHIQPANVGNVFVWNQAGQIGARDNANNVIIENNGVTSTLKIPLSYTDGSKFAETGTYYIGFDLNVDALTRITVTEEDKVSLYFVNGNSILDSSLIGGNPEVPCLTITGLPLNTRGNHFSEVLVHNAQGAVASCLDYSEILVVKDVSGVSAMIPLSYSANSREYFRDSGNFSISFKINVDYSTEIIKSAGDGQIVLFTDGSASFDISLLAPPSPAPYLTIANLPSHIQAENVTDVFIWNQAGKVGMCQNYEGIIVERGGAYSTIKIPLSYISGKVFKETGVYFVSFDLNVDAATRLTVKEDDGLKVNFFEGNASLDGALINLKPPAPYLVISGLPLNTEKNHFSNIEVHNASGIAAVCASYSDIVISKNSVSSFAMIPLSYRQAGKNEYFHDTGDFFLSFTIDVDANIKIVKSLDDGQTVLFTNGNASYDISLITPPPSLTITGLPKSTLKTNISNVFLHTSAGKVAKCQNYNAINVSGGKAVIPLVYNSTSQYFQDSGSFIVSFDVAVDVNKQISKIYSDGFTVNFTNGSGTADLSQDYGFFLGGLSNPDDNASPAVKKDTVFEMNGFYYRVAFNTTVNTGAPSSSSLAYIYASEATGGVQFEFSTTTPVYDSSKKGYYAGDKRALFKCVYLNDSSVKYAGKSLISGSPSKAIESVAISSTNAAVAGLTIHKSISGGGNPGKEYVNLPAGSYIFVLKGAGGGGGGGGINGIDSRDKTGGSGGAGGTVSELVVIKSQTSFEMFTGGGGGGSGHIADGVYQGAGGGGGGSGTSVYLSSGYFLCAGGGGGGSGGDANDGGGGAGGAGGAGGRDFMGVDSYGVRTYAYGSRGGTGGGSGGGNGGIALASGPGGMGNSFPVANSIGYNGTGGKGSDGGDDGGAGGPAMYSSYGDGDWRNTNDANGQGADGGVASNGKSGGTGGNNRNSTRGGGGSGGAGGTASDSTASAGNNGGEGSIVIYKVTSF